MKICPWPKSSRPVEETLKLGNPVLALIHRMPSNISRRMLFLYYYHRWPRVGNPVTFHEKINWRILKDRREILSWTCDKLAMKDYASKVQGTSSLDLRVPRTLWMGTDVRELANVEFPKHWVFKPNHRANGQVFFGHGQPDITALEEISRPWLRPTEATRMHEWAYLKARPLLLVEDFLGVPGVPPSDYKFYVFAGEVAGVEVHAGRYHDHRIRWYSPDWSPLDVTFVNYELGPAEATPPSNFKEMLEIASELGRPFDFMRVDLYNVDGDIFFGELTPYPASGIDRFVPDSFDDELGAKWKLPVL
jgi:hypothetical protein